MLVLVTGATGKVGQVFLQRFLSDERWQEARVRALCHNRVLEGTERLEAVRGSTSDRETVERIMDGVTHVVHLATVKEDPVQAMDVSVKGMFWLLETFRQSPTAQQFILIGGDCVVGHVLMPYDAPITELSPRKPYPGVYALSKVLEEVMLEQYYIQYGINGCCLRAPWIMEKDDFKYVLSFGDDQFGGPAWTELMSDAERVRHHEAGVVPMLLDGRGAALKRNFVHVSDLASAIVAAIDHPAARQQLFNIAMDEPVDYAAVAGMLKTERGLDSVTVRSPFHSNWLDNTKAKQLLGWRPEYDLERLLGEAFDYKRAENDPRKVWYVG